MNYTLGRDHQSHATNGNKYRQTDTKDRRGHLKHIDGDGDDNIKQVPQSQAANQDIGSIPHTLVLIYDPEQR